MEAGSHCCANFGQPPGPMLMDAVLAAAAQGELKGGTTASKPQMHLCSS